MDDSSDSYVAQLKEVFISCDTTGSGCLNASELKLLCKKLHLADQADILVNELLQRTGGTEARFEDFKTCFIALLSRSASNEEDNETFENTFLEESADREVSPKFILGRKKYGRRSRPASSVEDDSVSPVHSDNDSAEITSTVSYSPNKSNQKSDNTPGKRPVSPSYPQQPPTKSGRMTAVACDERSVFVDHCHQSSNFDNECNSYSDNNLAEYLQQTWKKLKIGSDGYLTVEELALVCEHIGMDMTEEVIYQLFEKLDCDQDGRISFNEFVQGLFQHGEPQNQNSTPSQSNSSQQLFKEPSRDEQISTSSISGLFSCLDEESKGFADGSSIVDLWELLEVPCSLQMLEDLGYSPMQKVNLSDLSNALEEEIISSLQTPLGQLAFISYQNELNYLRQCNEQIRTERNKLRESIEEANSRAALLAQEVDDNHAKLESALQSKLLLAEKRYHDQVRELVEDLQQERETIAQQTNKFKQQLQLEIQGVRDEESQLKKRLHELEQENARLEVDIQEATDRCREAEKQKEIMQKELSLVSGLKERLAELESHHGEIQEHQHQSLLLEIENYKKVNQELQDRIDELTAEIEHMQQATAADSSGTVSRTHSWLSDYKKAALVGFKRRGSDSSSDDNSDDECPTIEKVRRTFHRNGTDHSSLEADVTETSSTKSEVKTRKEVKCCHPSSIDILLRDMFVDRERLVQKLCDAEELKQKAEVSNVYLLNKCKLLTRIAYDAAKASVA